MYNNMMCHNTFVTATVVGINNCIESGSDFYIAIGTKHNEYHQAL